MFASDKSLRKTQQVLTKRGGSFITIRPLCGKSMSTLPGRAFINNLERR